MENNKTKSSAIQKILKCGIISWVAIIALWGIGSLKYDEYFLPSPKETIDSMKELIKDGTLWSDIVASVGRVIKGWLLSIIFAVPMGLIVGNFRPVRWLVEPIEKYIAYAAAGSDARMAGCENPVVINSGSGNQGITVSVPIIAYYYDNNISRDALYRSLVFSNLIALYIKEGIGELSAYCGVVSASAAAMAGLAFIKNEDKEIIKNTIINTLATNSGILCDGAKESCAAKIASSLKIAYLSYIQAKTGNTFKKGDGIATSDVDKMIKRVGNIAKKGMRETDKVILNEMINK